MPEFPHPAPEMSPIEAARVSLVLKGCTTHIDDVAKDAKLDAEGRDGLMSVARAAALEAVRSDGRRLDLATASAVAAVDRAVTPGQRAVAPEQASAPDTEQWAGMRWLQRTITEDLNRIARIYAVPADERTLMVDDAVRAFDAASRSFNRVASGDPFRVSVLKAVRHAVTRGIERRALGLPDPADVQRRQPPRELPPAQAV